MEFSIKTVKCYVCSTLIERSEQALKIIYGRGQSPICDACKNRVEYKHSRRKQIKQSKQSKQSPTPTQAPLEIEKNIPIPKKFLSPRRAKYPFSKMELLDSFFVEVRDTKHANQVRSNVYTCLKRHNEYHKQNIKLTGRYIKKDGGIRIWRIE